MILEFSCSNHKSIKEKVKFSMIAGSDTTLEESLQQFTGYKVLQSAVIYGANGSGKSNFISAVGFMHDLVGNSINHQPGQGIFQFPHKLSIADMPSEYEIQFVKDDLRFAYGFSIKNNLVDEEYLFYFPKGRQVKIFERKGMEIKPGDRYKTSFEVSINVLKENRLFLSCAANYCNLEEIERAFLFFRDDIIVYNPVINNWNEYSITLMQNNEMIKKIFVDILKALGTGVEDVRVKLQKVNINELPKEVHLTEPIKALLVSQEASQIEAKVIYDRFTTDLMTEESMGIKKLFEMICPIIDILDKGRILICDEFETSLHESVVFEIVKLFQRMQKNKLAQLIFTTHDTSLLDANLFRRDQIWFTQLNSERATDLYSLAEIRNVRKTENLGKGYVSGKYGAIPMLNQNFFRSFGERG